jgi:hypothetical protein
VTFVPSASGSRTALLQVPSDGSPPPDVQLAGTGVGDSGGATGGGTLSTSVAALDYRSIGLATGDRSEPLSVLVRNTSATTVTISAVTTTGPFLLVESAAADACRSVPWSLPPGAGCSVSVVYAPGVAGESTGVLTVQSGSGQRSEVTLAGQSTAVMTNVGGGALDVGLLLLLSLAVAAACGQRLVSSRTGVTVLACRASSRHFSAQQRDRTKECSDA